MRDQRFSEVIPVVMVMLNNLKITAVVNWFCGVMAC